MTASTATPPAAVNHQRDLAFWAFILSLIGGILLLMSALSGIVGMLAFTGMMGSGMMMRGGWGMGAPESMAVGGFMGVMVLLGLVGGIVALMGAFRVREDAVNAGSWGIAILVVGILNFVGFASTFGGALTIGGGILAIMAARRSPSS